MAMDKKNVPPYLELAGLTVGYGKKAVVSGVDIKIAPYEILTLIGPNGAGKSTILKTITRELKALTGVIYINGSRQSDLSLNEIAKTVSIVMTERPKPEYMTARDVVATGRYPYIGRFGILSKEDFEIVDEALRIVNAYAEKDKTFDEMSDGQKQRIMLARAIAQEPKVLILDEPTSFLDMKHKVEVLTSIRRLVRDKGIAVIMSLHELELAMQVSDRVACVDKDVISKVGTPEEIFSDDTIQKIYEMDRDYFDVKTGALYMKDAKSAPEVFVIGGGGDGLPVYRKLVREGKSFAFGILQENDVETSFARASGTKGVIAKAFELPSNEDLENAKRLIDECSECICAVKTFGVINQANRELFEYAKQNGKILKSR